MRLLVAATLVACSSSATTPEVKPEVKPFEMPEPVARIIHEESSDGETRLFSGAAADLDGDGLPELVAGGFSTHGTDRRSTVYVYRQSGETWQPVAETEWGNGKGTLLRNIEIADVDGDGTPDIVAYGRVGAHEYDAKARLAVFGLANGKLVKRAEIEWHAGGNYTHGFGLALGDLDGDGKPEIAAGGFQYDGTTELGFVRVWSLRGGTLEQRAETTLDGQGSPSMRVNDLAIADVDGDGRAEIVVGGRHGPVNAPESKYLDRRREAGDLSVLALAEGKLAVRTRYSWTKGTTMRIRSIVVADFDGDKRAEIVAGGQYDADGKASLALFAVDAGKLVLRHDASSTTAGVSGEVKDLVVARRGRDVRVLATGSLGGKPARKGDLTAWRVVGGTLVADGGMVSSHGDETRSRAVVLVPGKDGTKVLTIGHAKNQAAIIGQVLEWKLATR